jgi:hypothetical protein
MATAAEIAADLVELRAARMALAKGERIKGRVAGWPASRILRDDH